MICDLCKKEIETKREKYTHVEDWDCEKKVSEFWVHVGCFRKAMNKDLTLLEKQAKGYLEKAGVILNKMIPGEEYIIK